MDNSERSDMAQIVIDTYMDVHPDYKIDMIIYDEPVIDLIADILHYCDKQGMDVEAIIRMAKNHHDAEKGG